MHGTAVWRRCRLPEGQTVGEFLWAHGDRVALAVEHSGEVAALYRCESVKHVAFLSYVDWHYDLPLSARALVLPWLAYVHRIVEERRAAATPEQDSNLSYLPKGQPM